MYAYVCMHECNKDLRPFNQLDFDTIIKNKIKNKKKVHYLLVQVVAPPFHIGGDGRLKSHYAYFTNVC